MPKNAASAAAEYATTHGIKLLRVEAGMRQDALLLLEDLQGELGKIIASGKGSALKTQKYSMMLNEATATIDQTYKALGNNHVRKLEQLVGIEWDAANAMINKSVGVELVTGSIPTKLLEAAVNGPVILGHSSKEWWAGQSSDLRRQFTAQMGMGTLLGESVPDLVKRIQGAGIIIKPAPGSPPGIMKQARRNAEALVRSSVQSTSNHARLESFKAKPNIVKGIQWLATLDSRTTIICMALDGLQWRLPDYEPVGHGKAFPGATAHWGCRSTIISVLYSWQELSGKKLPELNQRDIEDYIQDKLKDAGKTTDQVRAAKAYTRASMDGQVAKAMNFEDFATAKGADFMEAVLGPGKAALYNTGKITFSDLTDQFNRPLTLTQLAKSVETGKLPPETMGTQFLPAPQPKAAAIAAEAAAKAAAEAKAAAIKAAEEEAAALAAKVAAEKAAALKLAEEEAAAKAAKHAAIVQQAKDNIIESAKKDAAAYGGPYKVVAEKTAAASDKPLGQVISAYNNALQEEGKAWAMAADNGFADPSHTKITYFWKPAAAKFKDEEPSIAKWLKIKQESESIAAAVSIKLKKEAIAEAIGTGKPIPAKLTAFYDALTPEDEADIKDMILAAEAKALKKAKKDAAKIPITTTAPDIDGNNLDLDIPGPESLTFVKDLPGSTQPKLMLDPATGKQWVVKTGNPDHLRSEAAADDVYRLMGARAPGSAFVQKGTPAKVAEFIPDAQTLGAWERTASPAEITAMHAQIRQHFVLDSLLGNWDVAGQSNDNILIHAGKAIRIDNGGAFAFRAQGAKKTAAQWGKTVPELQSLRNKATAAGRTADIFGGITQSEIDSQIAEIVKSKTAIVDLVKDRLGAQTAATVQARIDYLEGLLPASAKPAPGGAVLDFTPKFEEAAKTRYGASMTVGNRSFEDQELIVWHEKDQSRNSLIKAQGVLTKDGDAAFKAKIQAAGLPDVPASNPYASAASAIDTHPQDTFFAAFESAAKTVSTHAADGKYNASTLASFEEALKKLNALKVTGNNKMMVTYYKGMANAIQDAKTDKQPLSSKWKPFKGKVVGNYTSPSTTAEINGVTVSRLTTNGIDYTVKEIVNGELLDTGTTNRKVATAAAFKLQRGNVEITVVPYSPNVDSMQHFRSYQGIVRINVKGSDSKAAMQEATAILRDVGLLDTDQPSIAQRELAYLHKGVYLRGDTADAGYSAAISSGTDAEKVEAVKAWAEAKYGVSLPRKQTAWGRYYNPEGELPTNGVGNRYWRRWDYSAAEAAKAEKASAFYHSVGSQPLETVIANLLQNGGAATTTQHRLRIGYDIGKGGASSDSDLARGGGNYFYTNRIAKAKDVPPGIVFKGDGITRIDLASHTYDSFGEWEANVGTKRRRTLKELQEPNRLGISTNSGLFKNGLSLDQVDYIKTGSASERDNLIKRVQSLGFTKWLDGRALTDVIK